MHRVVVGSVGDSQAVLFRGGPSPEAGALTTPHTPSDAEEARRILERGGELRTVSDPKPSILNP